MLAKGMLIKEKLKDGLRVVSLLPLVSRVLFNHNVRNNLQRLPGARALYSCGWDRVHPFDRAYGADTSGIVSTAQLQAAGDHEALRHITVYGGSQPSVLRQVLSRLPQL